MPASRSGADRVRFCASCGRQVVVARARFCKECGAPLGLRLKLRVNLEFVPWIALALSILPGLGHLYRGQPWRAAGWLVLVALGYMAQPFGFVLHAICAANAALGGAIEFRGLSVVNRRETGTASLR